MRQPRPTKPREFIREPIPARVQHEVMLRDQGKCQMPTFGKKICGKTRWIHLHHIKAVSKGGENTAENLLTLCSTHHHWQHREEKVDWRQRSMS